MVVNLVLKYGLHIVTPLDSISGWVALFGLIGALLSGIVVLED